MTDAKGVCPLLLNVILLYKEGIDGIIHYNY